MANALSFDLRTRVLSAIDEGASCREAAERFGVSAASAIRWAKRRRTEGEARPRRQGGDRRSKHIEAHSALILSMVSEKPDMTLAEIKSALAEHGVVAGIGTLWRFFRRHRVTLKKSRHTPPNRSGRMS